MSYVNHLHMVPEHMHGAVQRYIDQGIPPGSFLKAVLRHDLFEAVGRADLENQRALVSWVQFFYNYAPSGCHGNSDKVDSWISSGGLGGIMSRKRTLWDHHLDAIRLLARANVHLEFYEADIKPKAPEKLLKLVSGMRADIAEFLAKKAPAE